MLIWWILFGGICSVGLAESVFPAATNHLFIAEGFNQVIEVPNIVRAAVANAKTVKVKAIPPKRSSSYREAPGKDNGSRVDKIGADNTL